LLRQYIPDIPEPADVLESVCQSIHSKHAYTVFL